MYIAKMQGNKLNAFVSVTLEVFSFTVRPKRSAYAIKTSITVQHDSASHYFHAM